MRVDTRTFSPGLRFSKLDAIILFVGIYIAADTAAVMLWPGIAICFVIAHFFLFCNLIRMDRSSELVWAALIVILFTFTIRTGRPPWPLTLAIAFLGAAFLIFIELRKPSYHGVFWRLINPNLPQWWDSHA
jgi:hypothetical protein